MTVSGSGYESYTGVWRIIMIGINVISKNVICKKS